VVRENSSAIALGAFVCEDPLHGTHGKLRDLDARGGSVLPASTETRTDYLNRVAGAGRGVVGSAARELLDQRDHIAELESRLARLEKKQ
jgi:hypothetical protein